MVRLIRIEVQRRIENEVKESAPENSAEPQKAHKTPEHLLAYQRDYYAKNREAVSLRRKIRRLKRKEAEMHEVHA